MRTSNTFADITADKPELGPHGMGYVTNGSKPRRAFWSIVLSIGFIGTVTVKDLKIFEAFGKAKLQVKVDQYSQPLWLKNLKVKKVASVLDLP